MSTYIVVRDGQVVELLQADGAVEAKARASAEGVMYVRVGATIAADVVEAVTRLEARSIIERMLADWPYQPPEVIEAERAAFRAWLDATRPPPEAYLAALHGIMGADPLEALLNAPSAVDGPPQGGGGDGD